MCNRYKKLKSQRQKQRQKTPPQQLQLAMNAAPDAKAKLVHSLFAPLCLFALALCFAMRKTGQMRGMCNKLEN